MLSKKPPDEMECDCRYCKAHKKDKSSEQLQIESGIKWIEAAVEMERKEKQDEKNKPTNDERKNAKEVPTPCQQHEKGETQESSSRQNKHNVKQLEAEIKKLGDEKRKLMRGMLTPNQNRMVLLLEKQKHEIDSYKKFDELYAEAVKQVGKLDSDIRNCIRYDENSIGHTKDGVFFEVEEVLSILKKVIKNFKI